MPFYRTFNRALIIFVLIVGSLGIAIVWTVRRPVLLIAIVSDWLDDRLIDLEEWIYEWGWVARSRLPAWKDE